MSEATKRILMMLVVVALILGGLVDSFIRQRECSRRHGLIVRGSVHLECVARPTAGVLE